MTNTQSVRWLNHYFNKIPTYKKLNVKAIANLLYENGYWVKLITTRHGDGGTNPVWGCGEGFVAGIKREYVDYGGSYEVYWLNGATNSYWDGDAVPLTKQEFAKAYRNSDKTALKGLLQNVMKKNTFHQRISCLENLLIK